MTDYLFFLDGIRVSEEDVLSGAAQRLMHMADFVVTEAGEVKKNRWGQRGKITP